MTWLIYIYYTAIFLAVVLVGLSAVGSFGLDLDGDGHPDIDHDHDHANPILSLLGIGRAPFSIMLMSYLLSFGAAGVLFIMVGSLIPNYEVLSFCFALGFSLVATGVFSRVLGRFIPSVETYTVQHQDLVGCSGTVITRVSPSAGSADVTDKNGSLHRIPAVTISGEIVSGLKILVVGYNQENTTFVVEQLPN